MLINKENCIFTGMVNGVKLSVIFWITLAILLAIIFK